MTQKEFVFAALLQLQKNKYLNAVKLFIQAANMVQGPEGELFLVNLQWISRNILHKNLVDVTTAEEYQQLADELRREKRTEQIKKLENEQWLYLVFMYLYRRCIESGLDTVHPSLPYAKAHLLLFFADAVLFCFHNFPLVFHQPTVTSFGIFYNDITPKTLALNMTDANSLHHKHANFSTATEMAFNRLFPSKKHINFQLVLDKVFEFFQSRTTKEIMCQLLSEFRSLTNLQFSEENVFDYLLADVIKTNPKSLLVKLNEFIFSASDLKSNQ